MRKTKVTGPKGLRREVRPAPRLLVGDMKKKSHITDINPNVYTEWISTTCMQIDLFL